jgi:hypothetical protein
MLKKINPKTGKKKKRPKIKLSLAYRFFFFKKSSPATYPFKSVGGVISAKNESPNRIGCISYLYYKNNYSSSE